MGHHYIFVTFDFFLKEVLDSVGLHSHFLLDTVNLLLGFFLDTLNNLFFGFVLISLDFFNGLISWVIRSFLSYVTCKDDGLKWINNTNDLINEHGVTVHGASGLVFVLFRFVLNIIKGLAKNGNQEVQKDKHEEE